jgi:hypothetical protein
MTDATARLKKIAGLFIFAAATAFGTTPAPAAPARCDLKKMAAVAIPPAYLHPKLMAIGDSIYNGMSSMTIDDRRARHSAPAFIARALGITRFRVPAYPAGRPLLADLDDIAPMGELWIADHLGKTLVGNITWWRDTYSGSDAARRAALFFDNIAVSQTDSGQLLCDRPEAHIMPAKRPIPLDERGIPTIDLFRTSYELNMRFVLNPNRSRAVPAGYGQMSQMAQVMARKPDMLLVNVGGNDGIWKMVFYGKPAGAADVSGALNDLERNMGTIAWNIPRETHRVVVNLLPPPSRIANLQGGGNVLFPGTRQYYERYQTFLNDDGLYTVSGNEARAMDARVAAVNRAIVRRMCGAANLTCNPRRYDPRGADPAKRTTLLSFVDTAAMAWRYDAKHIGPNGGDTVEVEMRLGGRDCRLRLDNREIRYALQEPERCIAHGGLFSYDNMHMTMIGYGLLANQVLAAIGTRARVDLQALADEIQTRRLPSALFINRTANGLFTHLRLILPHKSWDEPPKAPGQCPRDSDRAACSIRPMMGIGARH